MVAGLWTEKEREKDEGGFYSHSELTLHAQNGLTVLKWNSSTMFSSRTVELFIICVKVPYECVERGLSPTLLIS